MDFTYSGKWGVQKEEYNLYYMRDRYYSSELHRFLSLDKDQGDLYRPSTLNPYAYVGNDPINFIDPSGMTAVNLANAIKNTIFNEDGSINWGGVLELGKVALSFTPIGWAIDLYDLGKSILEFDWTWGGLADIGLNVVGLIPGVGDLAKASKLGKNAIKTVDAVADVTDGLNDARKAIKRTDALVDASKAAKNVGNGAEALDTANDARKAAKTFATEKEFTEYARNRVAEVRSKLPSKPKREGNMAISHSDIRELPEELISHSGINNINDKGASVYDFSLLQKEQKFNSYIDADDYDRTVDTEAKILEDIHSRIGNRDVRGNLYLYTQKIPCPSCQNIIEEFQAAHPNINLKVFYGEGIKVYDSGNGLDKWMNIDRRWKNGN